MNSPQKFYSGIGSQEKCHTENTDKNFFVCWEKPIRGSDKTNTYSGFKDHQDFLDWREKDGKDYADNFYEQITGECYEYYDIDGRFDFTNFQDENGNPFSEERIIENFMDAREDFQIEEYPDIPLKRKDFLVKITPDAKKEKFSAHIIIRNGFKFKNSHTHLKIFTKTFKEWCDVNSYKKVCFDKAVYTKNRNFRMLNNHKFNQPERVARKAEWLNKDIPDINYFITYIHDAKGFYPEIEQENAGLITKIHNEDWSDVYSNSKDKICRLIDMIYDNITQGVSILCDDEDPVRVNYNTWKKLVYAVFNSCDTEKEKIKHFRRIAPLYRSFEAMSWANNTDSEANRMINYKQYPWDIKNLHKWAKSHEDYSEYFQEEEEKYCKKIKRLIYTNQTEKAQQNESKKSEFKYLNQLNDFAIHTKKEPYNRKGIENVLYGIINRVCNGGKYTFFCMNDYFCNEIKKRVEKYDIVKDAVDLTRAGKALSIKVKITNEEYDEQMVEYEKDIEKIQDKVKAGKKLTQKELKIKEPVISEDINMGDIFVQMLEDGKVKTYNEVGFMPYLNEEIKTDNLNLFTGYPYVLDDSVDTSDYLNSRLYENLKTYLCNGEEAVFNWFEDFIAHTIQKPNELPSKMVVFISKQGTGKDALFKFLGKLVGHQHTLAVAGMDKFMTRFNGNQSNKLFVRINELSTKGIHFDKADDLKECISREYIEVEHKGIDSFQIPHKARYLGFSQHENVLKVENSDRRLCMIRCNSDKANNLQWFSKIWNEIEDEIIIKSAFQYYATRDITGFMLQKPPDTEYKREQKEQCMPLPLQFLTNIFDNNRLLKDGDMQSYKGFSEDIYAKFLVWMAEYGYSTKINRKFFCNCLRQFGVDQSRVLINGKRKVGFSFTKNELRLIYQEYLNDKTWDFEKSYTEK